MRLPPPSSLLLPVRLQVSLPAAAMSLLIGLSRMLFRGLAPDMEELLPDPEKQRADCKLSMFQLQPHLTWIAGIQ